MSSHAAPEQPDPARDASPASDEEAARRARSAFTRRGVPHVKADDRIAPLLGPAEHVLGAREVARLGRVNDLSGAMDLAAGRLYVTSDRLVHLGATVTSIPLADISEQALANRRLLLTLADSGGVAIDAEGPQQLRVLITAARNALLGRETGS